MIAILSDIHGNLEALHAVLQDAGRFGAEDLICLGDIVGYGADPNACVEVIHELSCASILGNHDQAALDPSVAKRFNPVAAEAIRWTADQMKPENAALLAALPLERLEHGARLVHASPVDPASWTYIMTEQEAWEAFGAFVEDICFVGHSHIPLRIFLRDGRVETATEGIVQVAPDERAIINVGSVGQPRDGDWRAAYALFDPVEKRVTQRRVEYDRPAAAQKILDAGLPEILAKRLARGQ